MDIVNVFVSIKVNKRGSTNERLHVFPKDERGYPFLSTCSCSDKTEQINFPYLVIFYNHANFRKSIKI